MLKTYQHWVLTAVALVCLLLVAANIALLRGNRTARAAVESRGQYIQQSIQLQGLYSDMVKALADLSVRNKDDQLRDLLSKEGFNVTVSAPATAAALPATPGKVRQP
jgi:ABC-type transport system involved in cytochrome bd biosynthesis fused ATPase/permease subunit